MIGRENNKMIVFMVALLLLGVVVYLLCLHKEEPGRKHDHTPFEYDDTYINGHVIKIKDGDERK